MQVHQRRTGAIMYALALCCCCQGQGQGQDADQQSAMDRLLAGEFAWQMSPRLVEPLQRPGEHLYSVKDPSVVFHGGRWHLFCTIRGQTRSHQIEYLSFANWDRVAEGTRHLLTMHKGYFCAPQVFHFAPQGKWYLICQASDESWDPKYAAAFATTTDVADPASWSALKPLGHRPADGKAGLDFWVMCDDSKAHLFFTTLDGRMWREETSLQEFPLGWSEPSLAIQGDIFEAGHVYSLKGLSKYLALIEAQDGHGWRYYKAYLADRLDGVWVPLAGTKDKAFASMANVRHPEPRWTDSVSHGELLRTGSDQRLEVDPSNLRFVFQGVLDRDRGGKSYGEIPWRLGLLGPDVGVPTPKG